MRKRNILLVAVVLCCAVAGISLVLGSLLNTISFPYTITKGTSMSQPISVDLGTITANASGGSGPSGNGSPVDSNATLSVSATDNITLSFSNSTDLSPFTAFGVLVQLYQNGSPIYQGGISEASTSYVIQNVVSGTYEIFVGYTYTAGLNATSGSIVVDVSG